MQPQQPIPYSELPRLIEPVIRIQDNPLLLAQARRRLRKRERTSVFTISMVVGVCALLIGFSNNEDALWMGIGSSLLAVIGITLLFRATSTLAGLMIEDRHSGILDFHRATPTTLWTDALGYLIGGAAREYLIVGVLAPFTLICMGMGGHSVLDLLLFLGVLVVNGWFYHAAALLLGLTGTGRKRFTNSAMVIIVVLVSLAWPLQKAGLVTVGYLTPWPALSSLIIVSEDAALQVAGVNFFGIPLHPVLFTLLVQGSLGAFLFWGTARKLQREITPAFSRPGALAFFSVLTLLVIGGSWGTLITPPPGGDFSLTPMGRLSALSVMYLFGATAIAVLLLVSLTPPYLEFVRALRRARRQGSEQTEWLADGAHLWPLVPAFFVLILGGLSLLMYSGIGLVDVDAFFQIETPLALTGTFSLLVFLAGVAEYVWLGGRKSMRSALLVLFLTCILPWMMAGIVASFGAGEASAYVAALSPVFGMIGSAIGMGEAWNSASSGDYPFAAVLLSQGVSVVIGLWFLVQTRSQRIELARTIPLGGVVPAAKE